MAEIKFSTGSGNSNTNMTVDGKKAGKTALIIIIVIAAIVLIFNSFTMIETGYIGVKYRFLEVVNDSMQPGLNFKIPFIEEIRPVSMQNQVFPWTGDAFTKDTQRVSNLELKLTYRYEGGKLSDLVRNVGIENIESRFLYPNVQKIAKDEIGRVNAEMLVQTRSTVQDSIERQLYDALLPEGIIVTAFAIENLSFESEFLTSVQNKVMAEQDALRQRFVTQEREEQAKQVIIAAEADAESVEIAAAAQAKAIELIQAQLAASPSYIEYLKIENWNGILPLVIGDGVNPFVVLDSHTNFPVTAPAYTPTATQDTP